MPSPGERLGELALLVGGVVRGDPATRVGDATHDSRQVIAGGLFIAIRGASSDGHQFCDQAAALGASAVMVEEEVAVDLPQLIVSNTRRAMPMVARVIHGDPSRKLALVGVTGTNGKTTTAFLIEAIAKTAGMRTGLIGTVFTRAGDDLIPNQRTTPESTDLQRILSTMVARGVEVVAAEVSSHAVSLGRIDGVWFGAAAFTNLSQDHLDFHGDMESYFTAKAGLFEPERVERAVINVEDPYGERLAAMVEVPIIKVGEGGDLIGRTLSMGQRWLDVELRFPSGWSSSFTLPLGGFFNLSNALVAAGCALSIGIEEGAIVEGLRHAPQIPGRFEIVSGDDPITIVVDYAHTPAGIEAVIGAARLQASGRVIVVIGAGGDRDRSKRPAMGLASTAADQVVVTSDNPRSEDPDAIIGDMIRGIPGSMFPIVEPDRATAIRIAIDAARPGDMVMVLGKGHERGQEVGGRVVPFDDREVARAMLAEMRGSKT